MTEDFEQMQYGCGCNLNLRRDGTVLSYSLCEKHFKQKKDAD